MSLEGAEEARPAFIESSFAVLADELLLNIIDCLDSHQSLCNLAATCRRFQGLAEPFIWRSLLVLKGTHAQNIAAALDDQDDRINSIQELSICYKNEYREGIESLNYYLGQMSKLRHLTLESPCPNNTEWRSDTFFDGWSRIDYSNLIASSVYPREGLTPALPMLQSINLHVHGPSDRKFKFDTRTAALFLHPTLRKISISCMDIDTDLKSVEKFTQHHKSTPLESLTFIECNVAVDCLYSILNMPKALKTLEIRERLYTFPDCDPSTDAQKRTSSPLFLDALKLQADSLKSLTHIGGSIQHLTVRDTDPEGAAKLASLTKLTFLELGFESHLYYYLLHSGFPPSLLTLKMLDAAVSLSARGIGGPASEIVFNSTQTLVKSHLPSTLAPGFLLHIVFSHHSTSHLFAIPGDAARGFLINTVLLKRPATYKIASMLKERGARLRIGHEVFESGAGFIPPFMFGEEVPEEQDLYDSDDYWRFNGVDHRDIDDKDLKEERMRRGETVACLSCVERGVDERLCTRIGVGLCCRPCLGAGSQCRWERADGTIEVAEKMAVGWPQW